MVTRRIAFMAALPILAFSAGAMAGEIEGAGGLPRFPHPREINNRYLPLASLKQDVLERSGERVERTVKQDLHKTFKIGNQTVDALAVEDREFANGKLVEIALDYFAQSDDGAVYYLGEDVDEYKNDKVTGHSGAWLFGRDTQKPGLIMPAHPKVGDKFKSEDVPNITWELDEIVSVSGKVKVPAGSFANCIKIKETLSDGKTEYKFYAAGVGCVQEIEDDGKLNLKSHQTVK